MPKHKEYSTLQGYQSVTSEKTIIFVLCVLIFYSALGSSVNAGVSAGPMKGPHTDNPPSSNRQPPTSCVQVAFLESIRFYQKWISPIGGDRCGFRPSCSQYGYSAVATQGPIVGLMMTADRLTRCNIWKKPGPDYFLLPNGRLYDPLSNNLITEK